MDGSLTSFIDEVCGESPLRVEDDLGDGYVRLRSSEAQRRQAKHDIRCTEDVVIELLRNARDAQAKNIFVALSREGSLRRIGMIDDGEGIPQPMQAAVFEPRVTSKLDTMHVDAWGVHGRGMALYSIAANAKSARIADSARGKGASFAIETDLESLPEKTDQSMMPVFSTDSEGETRIRGTRNINRVIAEFAWAHRGRCEVYQGSPTEIAATLFAFGCATVPRGTRAFCGDPQDLPLVKRLCLAAAPSQLVALAAGMGLDLSERSARRILDGDIQPQGPFLEGIVQNLPDVGGKPGRGRQAKDLKKALLRDARGLKIDACDLGEFTEGIAKAYRGLAERYYLDPAVTPEVGLSREGIHIRIPLNKIR
ncbi:MAG: ATP-binding protein [Eggerthellaceae bacterium]|jgi:hypothetical protein|nr:ATP-binding protein [Eggerthellaceae bacterium]MDR2716103.1 ATP-binding protein [Coriobacteriaceae bacterium]